MLNTGDSPAPQQTGDPRLLHKFLKYGVTSLSAAFLALHYLSPAPLLDPATAPAFAYVFLGVSFGAITIAMVALRGRVPVRRPGQSLEQYWASPEAASPILLFWFVMEGGAVMGAVGYLMTADPLSAGVMVIAVAAFWVSGPKIFGQGK